MNATIEIAFCFDKNMVYPACVAIASLLDFKKDDEIHYNISCICPPGIDEQKKLIRQVVNERDSDSKVLFYQAPSQFDDAYEIRDITASTYLRLCLHRILTDKEKVLYADADVLFQDSLQEVWKIDISDYLLAGVKGANNFESSWSVRRSSSYYSELDGLQRNYINAGILLMNLKAIRDWNPDEKWIKMAQMGYHYQDQDILNITCRDRIKYLDIRFNVQAHLEKKDFLDFNRERLYGKEQCEQAWENPAILHYTGPKPWNNRGVNKGKIWWQYVESQEDLKRLFDKAGTPNRKTTGLIGKINRHLPF